MRVSAPVLAAAFATALPVHAQLIPLRPGLVVNYAHKNFQVPGDEDFYVKVSRVDANEVVMTTRFVKDDVPAPGRPVAPILLDHVSRRELRGARRFMHGREERAGDTTEVRNRTVMLLSSRLVEELRSARRATFTQFYWINDPTYLIPIEGTFTLVARDSQRVFVDGADRSLPTLHIKGRAEHVAMGVAWDQELWFVDDTAAAWLVRDETRLATKFKGTEFHIRMASVATSEAQGAQLLAQLEAKLRDDCRAVSYGFYFASARADLSPASDSTFAVVAEVLRRHPDWRVTIEGHTDSIGGAEFNRSLADRRAAAVRERLVSGYRVAATQLTSAGFGLSRPVATNTTLEGRARNRRVELARACPPR